MEAHSNNNSSSSIKGFCDLCVWKRWQPTTNYLTCQGRMNEMISETMRATKGGNYRVVKKDAMRQILDEFCTDPNLDEDDDTTIQQTTRPHQKFCGDCLWKYSKDTCNAKVNNMVDAYSISRDKATETVLVDCIKDADANASVANITSTLFIVIPALVFISTILIYVVVRIGKMRDQAQTTTSRTRISQKLKYCAGVLVMAFVSSIFRIQYQSIATDTRATSSSKQKPDDAHITLCNRRVDLKNMPLLPPNLEFGFPNDWERSLSKPGGGIILDNEFLYGRTGNNIREFFHAFDWARNNGVGLVVKDRGFPMDKPLNELFMGLSRSHLEKILGFLFFDNVEEEYRSNLQSIRTGKLFYYGRTMKLFETNQTKSRMEQIDHRHYVLQELYRLTARDMELNTNINNSLARNTMLGMCQSLHAIFGSDGQGATKAHLKSLGFHQTITEKYTVIHIRSFEGSGKAMMEKSEEELGVTAKAYTDVPPEMMKDLLTPLEMNNNSILMISDGGNTDVIESLSSDPIIGPKFEVVPPKISTMISDGMLAILSNVFIGNPYSTYSQFIAQARYALGIGPSYLFIKRDNETKTWKAFCDDEDCFYNCTQGWP